MIMKGNYEKCNQIRNGYKAKLDVICEILKDVVPLKIRVMYKRRKLRLFEAVINRKGRKPPKRGKLTVSEVGWLGFYQSI